MTGAPTSMPTAKALIRLPTAGMLACRSAAIWGSRPAIMNSDVPRQKIVRVSA